MKSIIFNQHQVNHALKNKEGMFRVVVKLKKNLRTKARITTFSCCDGAANFPFEVGEEIFVKETFSDERFGASLIYKAGNVIEKITHWRTASNMKQEHSRLTLRIKSVKVERLQDISCVQCFLETGLRPSVTHMDLDCDAPNPKDDFRTLWNSTHKKPEEKWEANPFVFCFSYEVVR